VRLFKIILLFAFIYVPYQASADDFGPQGVCASGAVSNGLDVSNYQTGTHWDAVYQSGRRFTFVKATEGQNYLNPEFANDWTVANTVGMMRGAYHYFSAFDDPIQQASFYLSTLGNSGNLEVDDLPPMLDLESSENVSPEVIVENARTWLDSVEKATGKIPVLYTYPAFWQALGNPPGFDRYPLFIADYSVKCPVVPAPWIQWTFWQQGIGTSSGVHGKVDLDLFNGGFADLQAFAQH
jgi:lysozyme